MFLLVAKAPTFLIFFKCKIMSDLFLSAWMLHFVWASSFWDKTKVLPSDHGLFDFIYQAAFRAKTVWFDGIVDFLISSAIRDATSSETCSLLIVDRAKGRVIGESRGFWFSKHLQDYGSNIKAQGTTVIFFGGFSHTKPWKASFLWFIDPFTSLFFVNPRSYLENTMDGG